VKDNPGVARTNKGDVRLNACKGCGGDIWRRKVKKRGKIVIQDMFAFMKLKYCPDCTTNIPDGPDRHLDLESELLLAAKLQSSKACPVMKTLPFRALRRIKELERMQE
jgi:hypothetical protein